MLYLLRRFLSVIVGSAAAMVVLFGLESLMHRLYPTPPGLNLEDTAAVSAWVATMPVGAFLLLLGSYAASAFVGGLVAMLVVGRTTYAPAFILGALLTVMGLSNLLMIHHPLWFAIAATLVYVPAAWLGARLVERPDSQPATSP